VKGCGRVAVIDYDVHHGNGTEDIFSERSDILYVSTHQWGIYPGTGNYSYKGEEGGEGHTLNLPFPHGTGDSSYKLGYNKLIKPIVSQFKPDMILISLGTDGHYKDPIATLTLSSKIYYWLAKQTMSLADELCEGRVAFLLEGGYDLEAIAEVVAKIVAEFQDRADDVVLRLDHVSDVNESGAEVVKEVMGIQKKYWKL
jgi:acetoin utilization deacetylase AcuC-like enzyme